MFKKGDKVEFVCEDGEGDCNTRKGDIGYVTDVIGRDGVSIRTIDGREYSLLNKRFRKLPGNIWKGHKR